MLQRQKKKDPPQDYTGQLFRRNFQRLISSVFPKLIFYLWLPAQQKYNRNMSGSEFSSSKNVPVKSSRVNCHELKTFMTNTSHQKTNIEKRETIRKITKVLPKNW